ncbi:SDR family NAD(P)-dependent oxidoreductase [Novosphingobium sp. 9U]|uniref:SDR family NAD(P)-dependent oxidoreductase n=1 Tax=Novosphingobium sp. 9U TaxID=2653158 RepID=UPI0012F051B7|nr:SDR family oxidoreductase [Novosphingobium sp. 9U]VWX49975.1 Dehydrogenase [Novosphingobium sp. 9U]
MVGILQDRTALVTGAASGIGLGIAQAFVREGARVIAVDISGSTLSAAFDGVDAVTQVELDVSLPDAPSQLVETARATFGGLDILMNNAGITGALAPIHETDDANWYKVMSVNMDPVFRITRDFVPLLKESKFARVINTASVCSKYAIPLVGVYTASKHAVLGLTKAFALDLGQYGITVNCIMPANVVTGITKDFYPDPESEYGKEFLSGVSLMGRYGRPEDMAGAVLYLASDAATYVTGTALAVDAGMMARMPSLPDVAGQAR